MFEMGSVSHRTTALFTNRTSEFAALTLVSAIHCFEIVSPNVRHSSNLSYS